MPPLSCRHSPQLFAEAQRPRRRKADRSHPESPSRPSEEDKRLAYDSKASYMILSLMEPEKPVLNSFHIEGDVSTKEELVIC